MNIGEGLAVWRWKRAPVTLLVVLRRGYDGDQHRKGIGSEIFNAILVLMDQPKTITLTVNRKNIKAINFYFKIGFTIKSAEDFDIGNGYYMNDFVMVKKF